MSEVNEGWIPCTEDNQPPVGFRFDLLYAEGDVALHGDLCLGVKWEARCKRGDYWRPAADDGWRLNDGTDQTGLVDIVFRYGGVLPSRESKDWNWCVTESTYSILWWRPAASAVTEESEESELSLLSKLISAQDEYRRADTRLVEAYEAIRDVMGERDRVIMRHDGDLYLVEWDDTETVSWVQIEGI